MTTTPTSSGGAVQTFLQDLQRQHKANNNNNNNNNKNKPRKKKRQKEHTDDSDRPIRKMRMVGTKQGPSVGASQTERGETAAEHGEMQNSEQLCVSSRTRIDTPHMALPLLLQKTKKKLSFDHRYILAPMVGASELPFRLLCRRYGAQLAYTPMMSAHSFAYDAAYRHAAFFPTTTTTTPPAAAAAAVDRPLVCHFAANNVTDFCAAAVAAEPYCDAIDLNLGCPQRTAYVGHFGSYLLSNNNDRQLICHMVHAASQAVAIPIFCKIRLLSTLPETIALVRQLAAAGASLIAIHARYRASWERHGPGARDGPAFLDQVAAIRRAVRNNNSSGGDGDDVEIVTNGNTITWHDVVENLELTQADGLMSAEGMLDNPALFLPRWGSRDEHRMVSVPTLTSCLDSTASSALDEKTEKKKRKLLKKLREIEKLEEKVEKEGIAALKEDDKDKLNSKPSVNKKLAKLEARRSPEEQEEPSTPALSEVALSDLYKAADDKLNLCKEYLSLATRYPVKIRSVIFHIRRMIKDTLVQYQLLEQCLACRSVSEVKNVIQRIEGYQANPDSFVFDQKKAQQEKDALERKRAEEGKRKAYEARMMRKAKREGKKDLMHYLRIGAEVPTSKTVKKLKKLPRQEAMAIWKEKHSQHCLAFHIDEGGCKRGRGCAFLHVDCVGKNTFVEEDEVAG